MNCFNPINFYYCKLLGITWLITDYWFLLIFIQYIFVLFISIFHTIAIIVMIWHFGFHTVIPNGDFCEPWDPSEDTFQESSGTSTPQTPPFIPSPAPPLRRRAMAQLRPMSLPDVVQSMVGKDASQALKNFDRHYMPDGNPNADASARGTNNAHRNSLKRSVEGISRSLREVFAYLTHGIAWLEETKKLLNVITNVTIFQSCIIPLNLHMGIIVIMHIIACLILALGLQAGRRQTFFVAHNSEVSETSHVVMLPGYHEVFGRWSGSPLRIASAHYIIPASLLPCSFGWNSGPWFLLDRSNRCHEKISSKAAG